MINRYPIFVKDIEPKGFDLVVMDGFLSKKTIQKVRKILESREQREKMVNYNYKVASRHYSYSMLRSKFSAIMNDFLGELEQQRSSKYLDQQGVIYLKDRSITSTI